MQLPYPLFWAGSSLEFTFTGSELHLAFDADFEQAEPWAAIEKMDCFDGVNLVGFEAALEAETIRY